jgi:hypothetical protein
MFVGKAGAYLSGVHELTPTLGKAPGLTHNY